MENSKIQIELKSEVLNEVLSSPPSWLIRSGNSIFFLIILLLLGLSCIISYPDELIGKVDVYSNHPPIEFQNQVYSKLVDLQVKDQQFIKKGKILAQFNNEINPKNIEQVQLFMHSIEKISSSKDIKITSNLKSIDLGLLQNNWSNLLSLINEKNLLISSDISMKKNTALRNEIRQRKQLQSIANRKLKIIEKEISLQQSQLFSSQRLLNKNAISKEEYLKEEKAENQLQQQYQNQQESLIQNDIQLNSLMKNFHETQFNDGQQFQKLQASIKSNINTLQNAINDWGKSTAWVAPVDGKILFNKQLHVSSFYKTEEASLVLVPKGNYFRGILKISSQGAGKIEKGQKVFIEFKDFPKNDYGMLEGKVKSITSIAKNDEYEVEIQLPKKLITTYEKEIPVKSILKGNAKIITKNKRLINRFFEKVINLIEK